MGRRVSITEAAASMSVSKYTVRAWLAQRRLPAYRLGRRVVLDVEEIEQFVRAGRIAARESAK